MFEGTRAVAGRAILNVVTTVDCTNSDRAKNDRANVDPNETRAVEDEVLADPVIRRIKISGSTIVVPEKPIVIGSADDPTSNRQFQLEVTVMKLK